MGLIILYWVLIVVMIIGVVGALIPGIPGPSLILAAILIWGFATGFQSISGALIVVCLVLLLGVAIEFLASYWGVKQVGASKWAQFGAIAGMVIGLLGFLPALPIGGPLIGILLGPVLGAFIGEFLYRGNLNLASRTRLAFKVSLAVVVSSVIGNLIEGLLALISVIVFLVSTWSQVTGV